MKNNFKIDSNYPNGISDADVVVMVPKMISSKQELLDAFEHGLNFPNYFGKNWDAFEECINDLSWLEKRKVVIIHEDVPDRLPKKDLNIYLEILQDAVAGWRNKPGKHELEVVFPRDPFAKKNPPASS